MFKKCCLWLIVLILISVVVFSLNAVDSSAGVIQLPQTGQTTCYNGAGNIIPCAGTGQDGDIQAGMPWPNPRFTVGTGTEANCIMDNLTGLMWPKNGNLDNAKLWHNAVDYAINLTLCGYSDWRLPNINELESLVNTAYISPAIWLNTQGFTNVQSDYYWSSTTYTYNTVYAWVVGMNNGYIDVSRKGTFNRYVWPVRDIQGGGYFGYSKIWKTGQTVSYRSGDDGDLGMGVAWPNPRFMVGTGTEGNCVTDNLTGLMWSRDAVAAGYIGWTSALNYANNLILCGYSDWRLPNIKELRGLIDYSRYNPALPTGHPFSYVQTYYYWSSTTYANDTDSARLVYMVNGYMPHLNKANSRYVWPVRGGQAGSFGTLDHFEITDNNGNPIGSQSVNTQLPIRVTARNANGDIFNYNGGVSIWSNAGQVNPITAWLNNGLWTGYVIIYEGGTGIYLGANSGGKSGISNSFNVTGGVSNTGNLGGIVKDTDGNMIHGATVNLYVTSPDHGGMPMYSSSSSNGIYEFNNIPCGNFYIRAEDNNAKSQINEVSIACNRTLSEDLIISYCNPDGRYPILLVPGIMGSDKKYNNNAVYPILPNYVPLWNSKKLKLHDPFDQVGWDNLKDELDNQTYGYKTGCTMFDVPYDWRINIDDAWALYLTPWINEAKSIAGTTKVNIIAHSMGGLLTRAYIQSNSYAYDIDKFAMVGTPNHGAANAYYLWEGGEPLLADTLNSLGSSSFADQFYSEISNFMYQELYKFPLCKRRDDGLIVSCDQTKAHTMYHEHVPSLKQLMPTFNGVLSKGDIIAEENLFIKNLNNDLYRFSMVDDNLIDPNNVMTKIFAGTGKETIRTIFTGDPPQTGIFYPDGVPRNIDPYRNYYGDGTVLLIESVDVDFLSPPQMGDGDHSNLINVFRCDIIDFITDSTNCGQTASASFASQVQAQGQVFTNLLSLNISGRVQPYIVDPNLLGSGINHITGIRENNIPNSTVSIGVDAGGVAINNPVDGTYIVYLKAIYSEDHNFSIGYMDSTNSENHDFHGFNHANITSFTFTISSSSNNKITINHTPLSPTGLQANAIESGGLKTVLTWDISTDPEVVGFNIYSREYDEPYLHHIGTSEIISYDTGHSWAENSLIKTRRYAVSAVKSDGTESFLSDMIENNDRDHDGLTDEEEVSYGTDINNADSDNDGLSDSDEYVKGTDPWLTDTDGDTISDFNEVQNGTDPLNQDTDGDEVNDLNDTCPTYSPVRIDYVPPMYYSSLQIAVNGAITNDILQMHNIAFTEDIFFNNNFSITLESGYDCSYTTNTGTTTVNGSMTINDGVLTIQSGTLRIQ